MPGWLLRSWNRLTILLRIALGATYNKYSSLRWYNISVTNLESRTRPSSSTRCGTGDTISTNASSLTTLKSLELLLRSRTIPWQMSDVITVVALSLTRASCRRRLTPYRTITFRRLRFLATRFICGRSFSRRLLRCSNPLLPPSLPFTGRWSPSLCAVYTQAE